MGSGQCGKGGGFNPAKHLLSELQVELDAATAALDDANRRLAELETAFNRATRQPSSIDSDSFKRLSGQREIDEAALRIDALYDRQHIIQERFRRMETAYCVAREFNLVSVIEVNLRNLLLKPRLDLEGRDDVRDALSAVAAALHRYCWQEPSDEADSEIRRALAAFDACHPSQP
ncbi:MAG: hypothetical protein HQL33_08425 [Alphaproteobacteria bacterium]|nr:hypothetical protein [Alphaproteobacteria bacterium]MBF0130005.1 hypothetical protein [Alphaproteobacteria bacterium]